MGGIPVDRRASAGLEIAGEAVEERGPVLAAQRFDHLDADDRVVRSARFAVILEPDLDVVATAGSVQEGIRRYQELTPDVVITIEGTPTVTEEQGQKFFLQAGCFSLNGKGHIPTL